MNEAWLGLGRYGGSALAGLGAYGWVAVAVLGLWILDSIWRGRVTHLAARGDARHVGGALHGVAMDLPALGAQTPFELGPPPAQGDLEPDLGDHELRLGGPTDGAAEAEGEPS